MTFEPLPLTLRTRTVRPMSNRGITGGSMECPACGTVGIKTPRVGTLKCVTPCRVHYYQRALPETGETDE